MVVDELVDPNLSTFTPLEQEVHSNIKYIGMGYMPCNGYVPCQVIITSIDIYNVLLFIFTAVPPAARPAAGADRGRHALP